MQVTRRALLMAAGLALAGCRSKPNRTPALPATDGTAIDTALAAERQLLAAYDVAEARLDAVAAMPLARAKARHAAHVAALESVRRTPTPSPSTEVAPLASGLSLRTALRQSVHTLQESAVAVSDGPVAALLASIAAEHAADAGVRAGA